SEGFDATDAPLYVAARYRSEASGAEEYVYEQDFFELEQRAECRLIFLEGREGLGKSSFLRYYFDCYRKRGLPDLPSGPGGDLVLYADVRYVTDQRNLEDCIYGAIAQQIRAHFPMLSVENDFAMWAPRALW